MRPALVFCISIFCLLLLSADEARSQEVPRSYLFLEVKDSSGKAVADAAVTVSNDVSPQDASLERQGQNLTTDKDGLGYKGFAGFRLPSRIKLQVSKPGYLPYEQVFFACCQGHIYADDINSAGEFRPSPDQRVSVVLLRVPATSSERNAIKIEQQRRQLLMSVKRGDVVSLRTLLRASRAVKTTDDRGVPIIVWAAVGGHTETIELLLAAGADISTKNALGYKALLLYLTEGLSRDSNSMEDKSAVRRREEVVRKLIKAGAGVNIGDSQGETVLHKAVARVPQSLSVEALRALLKAGASVNAVDASSKTPLMVAAQTNSPETIRLLLAEGASINAQDKNGWTALMYAVAFPVYGRPEEMVERVRLLLEAGADLNLKNNQGRTALMLARETGIETIIRLLAEAERRR